MAILWDLQGDYCAFFIKSQIFSGLYMSYDIEYNLLRAWYNGSTKASQALDEGSIPFARTKNSIGILPI